MICFICMARISLIVPDEDLELIDRAAVTNRTAFMVTAARDAAQRALRAREDEEIARICSATAARDEALAAEFEATVGDGLV